MDTKRQVNFRCSDRAAAQLDSLRATLNETQSGVVMLAIDHLYNEISASSTMISVSPRVNKIKQDTANADLWHVALEEISAGHRDYATLAGAIATRLGHSEWLTDDQHSLHDIAMTVVQWYCANGKK